MKTKIFASGNALQICDATTGHAVRDIAFCDTPERAILIARRLDASGDLLAALDGCLPFIDDACDVHNLMSESAMSKECRDAVTKARSAIAAATGSALAPEA